jgi:hypothetical protein
MDAGRWEHMQKLREAMLALADRFDKQNEKVEAPTSASENCKKIFRKV